MEARTLGDRITLGVVRAGAGGEAREVEVELEARPPEPSEADRMRQEELGFAVRNLAFRDRVERSDPPDC